MTINIIMAIIFKYSTLAFVFSVSVMILLYCVYYLNKQEEPFTTDWDPIGDPNHVKYHQNEIFYLKDWINILDKRGKTEESADLKDILNAKEVHLKWHLDQYPNKSPPTKQTHFLLF